jgi:hypothetical protein
VNPEPETPAIVGDTPPPAATPPQADAQAGETANGSTELPEWARNQITKANAEAANYRTKLREAEQRLGSAKSPGEVETALAELRDTNATLERQLLVRDVGSKAALPDDLAELLKGSTREELEAHAKKLQQYATPAPPVSLRGGLDPTDDGDTETDPRELARRYGGRRH